MLGRFSLKLLAVFRFLKSPEGIFAFRLGIVSVALWIPAVCHSSAWLYYENRGVWALIMAQVCLSFFWLTSGDAENLPRVQTALAVYAGDQVGYSVNFFTYFSPTIRRLQPFFYGSWGHCRGCFVCSSLVCCFMTKQTL